MKHILVPVGSSENAQNHVQYAIDFAKEFGAQVFVVQVYNVFTKAGTLIKVDQIIEKESKAFLEDLVSKVDTKGVDVKTKTFKGELVDTLELICKNFGIDLIMIEPKTNDIQDEIYLDKTTGKIIKQTKMPTLIVPEGLKFAPYKKIMLAVKSAIIKNDKALIPLKTIKERFASSMDILLVKTPYHKEGDFDLNDDLSAMSERVVKTTNPTTYQGVLEHFSSFNPDLLVVVRRKRGFFLKLWEKNTILKKDFYIAACPVLVLREMK